MQKRPSICITPPERSEAKHAYVHSIHEPMAAELEEEKLLHDRKQVKIDRFLRNNDDDEKEEEGEQLLTLLPFCEED